MAKEGIPPVRLQKGGNRKRITSIVLTPRKAGKTRQRNRIHRGKSEGGTVGHLIPQWVLDRATADRKQSNGRFDTLGIH